ncbi:response regulator [Ramlibacter humi]|uniref:response regulator n=1 Tax=Ramlibacter humi TaxID=2530451 RepID=UPI00197D3FD9|nr:response regulator [Ramlibacter humi]
MLVALADDNADLLTTLSMLIQSDGHQVLTAGHGLELPEIVQLLRPQAVVLDLRLKNMDGLEACRRIRRDSPDTVCIAFTGLPRHLCYEQAIEAGVEHFVAKPHAQRVLSILASLGRERDCPL